MNNRNQYLEDLIDALSNIKHVIANHYNNRFHTAKFDLSPQQLRILLSIFEDEGSTVKQIAAKAQITSGAVTQFIDQLDAKKLVTRMADTTDRRISRLSITPEAKDQLRTIKLQHRQTLKEVFSCLTDAEANELGILLKKVIEHNANQIQTKKKKS